ncbi:hypothetical protein Rsub_04178 [Raphidocelis subcapitata]|uniref:Uncharacterized protein n=1 Tax=Raphidocelis subcapitata TaxID=307507 RepID=A0A2V0NUW8_9CHLO|nr:hypothetical protein Rsub_04178 [Raphidocelis subcapitata]|eukprot:GBF91438.1 hypothetical protein Rsub_04178 [Raphidocelis subcapitata]
MDPEPAAAACSLQAEGAEPDVAALRDVAVRPPCTRRQFDRSRSFTGLSAAAGDSGDGSGPSGSIELAARLREGDGDGGDDDDSSSTSTSGSAGTADADDRGGGARRGEGWASFEIAEPSTEAAFVRAALAKKTEECEHLRSIVAELSRSRARVHKQKVALEEGFAGLQKEYVRVARVADLARTVSQQSLSRSNAMRKELQAATDAASRATRRGAAAADKCRRLKAQNSELRQRVALLEGLVARVGALEGANASACKRAFLATAEDSLY